MFSTTDVDPDTLPSVHDDPEYADTAERLQTVREKLRSARDRRDELAATYRDRYGGPEPVGTEVREGPDTVDEAVDRILAGDEPEPGPRQELWSNLAEAEDAVRRFGEALELLKSAERKKRLQAARKLVVEVEDRYKAKLEDALEAADAFEATLEAVEAFEAAMEAKGLPASKVNPIRLPFGEVDGFRDRVEARLAEEIPPAPEQG